MGPNDSIATAQAIDSANTIVNATISSSSDSDFFRVIRPAGRSLTATLIPNPTSDYDLELYNGAGTLITASRFGTGVVDILTVTVTATSHSATYYVRVIYYSGGTGSTNGKYAITLNW